MKQLHFEFPEDDDAGYLYALCILADEPDIATALLQTIWKRAPVYLTLIGWWLRDHNIRRGEIKLVQT